MIKQREGGGPLFASGGALADAIVQIPKSPYARRRQSLYALIMQIFRGERSCPEDLEKMILQAVKVRLKNEPPQDVSYWIERTREAISFQNRHPDDVKPLEADQIFAEMLEDAEQARIHFIINFRTIEEHSAQGKAKSLQSILVRRLHLYDSELVDVAPTTRYAFCLPTPRSAEFFWLGLFNVVTQNNPAGQELNKEKARQRLSFLSKELLQVWVVPECMCGCPVVVFNPQDGATAYSFCFHPNDRVSVMKWDDDSISKWNMLIYTPFNLNSPKIQPKEPFGWEKTTI